MKKIVVNFFICLYFIITILITYCLLSYNKYNIPEFDNHLMLILDEKMEKFDKGDLLIIDKSKNFDTGDDVFYYDTYSTPVEVKLGKISKTEIVNDKESSIVIDDDIVLSSDNILGKKSTVKSYHLIGTILSILTSRWGYLFIIVLPMLLAFIYEIYEIVKEIKKK